MRKTNFVVEFIKPPSSWNFRQKMFRTHAVFDCYANAGSEDSGMGSGPPLCVPRNDSL